MPFNLSKTYNQLLEILHLQPHERKDSLYKIFHRDIENNDSFYFKGKKINPRPGSVPEMQNLFNHLITKISDEEIRSREIDIKRAERLHWIRNHIEERSAHLEAFTIQEPQGFRTYILDLPENYVIILEPYRNQTEYYLLTAFYLEGRNGEKFKKKLKRRLPNLI